MITENDSEQLRAQSPAKKCIICKDWATHCMRGLPNNKYCKQCAQEHFKLLSYLEQLR